MKNPISVIADDKIAFVMEVHHRLSAVYGTQIKYFHDLDALSELVSALLSEQETVPPGLHLET